MIEKTFINNQLGIKFKSYIDRKCRVWFKAKEVATILGYQDTNDAVRKHVSENHKRRFILRQPGDLPGCSMTYFVDEPGFYELVFKSRLQSARIFREWVFSKLLPSIRKYGYYKIIDSRIKQRVIIDGVKYYKHPVFSNYAASRNGDVINVKTKRIMNIKKRVNSYLLFTIYNKKLEKPFTYLQHRFVYEVFRGPIPKCFEVDHVNNNKTDNRINNLQLLTPRQNSEKSNNRPIISINIETGKETRYISIKKAAIKLDINSAYISDICRKKAKTATSKKNKKIYTFRYLD